MLYLSTRGHADRRHFCDILLEGLAPDGGLYLPELVALALFGSMPRTQAVLNGAGSFLAAWLYFVLLERTDNRQDRALHWLILIGGFFLLIASRLYIDIRVYGISF